VVEVVGGREWVEVKAEKAPSEEEEEGSLVSGGLGLVVRLLVARADCEGWVE
jgi:hypothetical protein